VDPEVLTQFNCLQQTGNFCPSASNGPAPMSSSATPSTQMSSSTTSAPVSNSTISRQAAADAFFALAGMQEDNLGSLGALHDHLALTVARHR
jgi:hypothetical protein